MTEPELIYKGNIDNAYNLDINLENIKFKRVYFRGSFVAQTSLARIRVGESFDNGISFKTPFSEMLTYCVPNFDKYTKGLDTMQMIHFLIKTQPPFHNYNAVYVDDFLNKHDIYHMFKIDKNMHKRIQFNAGNILRGSYSVYELSENDDIAKMQLCHLSAIELPYNK